jgi:hypothetical protein
VTATLVPGRFAEELGVVNPVGVLTVNVVDPGLTGLNEVVVLKFPGEMMTGELTIVPVDGLLLVTVRLTDEPGARGRVSMNFELESSRAAETVMA